MMRSCILRFNEKELGLLVFRSQGDPEQVMAHEALLLGNRDHWLANEVLQYWKRVSETCRCHVAFDGGAGRAWLCFAGVLAELLWSVDRSLYDGRRI